MFRFSVANGTGKLYISTWTKRVNMAIVIYFTFYSLKFLIKCHKFRYNYLFRVSFIYCQFTANCKDTVVKVNADISDIFSVCVDALLY